MFSKSIQNWVRTSSVRITHVKVYFNKTKIVDYTNHGVTFLKNVLPKLKPNRLYSVNVFYKENGMYYDTDIIHAYAFLDRQDKVILVCQKRSFFGELPKKQYVEISGDFYFTGQATKKVVVEEVPFSILDLHVFGNDELKPLNKHVYIVWKDQLNIFYEVDKILSDYEYDWVSEPEMNERCKMNELGDLVEKDWTNTICVNVKINRKRGIWERISLWFKLK